MMRYLILNFVNYIITLAFLYLALRMGVWLKVFEEAGWRLTRYQCFVIAAFLTVTTSITPARAHSWYEAQCCGDKDCTPAAIGAVSEEGDNVYVQGFGVLSHSDPRIRWGHDDQYHVCVSSMNKLLCIYKPRPKGM